MVLFGPIIPVKEGEELETENVFSTAEVFNLHDVFEFSLEYTLQVEDKSDWKMNLRMLSPRFMGR